jgi:sulfate/thiosulfate transport system ATP-binding protein
VTHDQEEALEVSDRVVVMNRAKIEQVGSPFQVFHQPASEFVIDFLGNVNVFHGRVEGGRAVLGDARIALASQTPAVETQANVYVRPHELEIDRLPDGNGSLSARIVRINPAGSLARITLVGTDGREIQVDLPYERFRKLELKLGEHVYVVLKQARVFVPEYVI